MEKEVKTNTLKKLEKRLKIIGKSGNYIEQELFKIKEKERKLKEKIRKEKKAISFVNRAKRLRSSKK